MSEHVRRSGVPSSEQLHALTDAFVACSRRSLEWFRQPLDVQDKGTAGGAPEGVFDPVTVADGFVEDLLRGVIDDAFPGSVIVGEERGRSGSGPLEWIIDPIDGTRAFISGQPSWGTLIGLSVEGSPVAGWMHMPVLDETYVAIDGVGTLVGGAREERPLRARPGVDVAEKILLCTHPSMFVTPEEISAFARVASQVRLTRYGGDCLNYGLVAAGFADVVIENQLQPYDIRPLIPIVEAAGGCVTDLQGNAPLGGGFVVTSANPSLHAVILDLLSS